MSFSDSLGAALVLMIGVVAVVVASVRLARWAAPGDDGLARVVIGVLTGVLQVVLVLQITGVLGVLQRGAVVAGHVLLTALILRFVPSPPDEEGATRARPDVLPLFAVVVGVGFLAIATVLSLRANSQESDTGHYHAPNAGVFLQRESVWKLPPATPGYFTNAYPADGELVGLWLMLPTHDDRLAYTEPLIFAVLGTLGCALVAKELGGKGWAGAVAGIAVFAAPVSFHTQVHSMMVDAAAAAAFVAGVGLTLRARRMGAPWPAVALAGASFGLAMGTKYPVLLPALGGLAMLAALLPAGRHVRGTTIAVAAAAVPSALWFIRAWVATGNPIFPKGVEIGGREVLTAGQTPLRPLETTMLEHLLHLDRHAIGVWAEQAARSYGPVLLLVGVSLVGTIWVGVRQRRPEVLAVAVLGALAGLAYLATPYTGGGEDAVTFLVSSQLRYALPAVLLMAAAGAGVLPLPVFGVAVAPTLAWDAVRVLQGPSFRSDVTPHARQLAEAIVVAAAIIAVLAILHRGVRTPLRGWSRALALGGLGIVVLVLGAAAIDRIPGPDGTDPAGAALARARRPDAPVLLVGVDNVRAFQGPEFDNVIATVRGGGANGEKPIVDRATFDAAVVKIDPGVIVVGHLQDTAPAGWEPEGSWSQVATVGPSRVFAPSRSTPEG